MPTISGSSVDPFVLLASFLFLFLPLYMPHHFDCIMDMCIRNWRKGPGEGGPAIRVYKRDLPEWKANHPRLVRDWGGALIGWDFNWVHYLWLAPDRECGLSRLLNESQLVSISSSLQWENWQVLMSGPFPLMELYLRSPRGFQEIYSTLSS